MSVLTPQQVDAINTANQILDDAELFDWEKYNQRLQMVLSINNQTTISQIETLYLEFQNI